MDHLRCSSCPVDVRECWTWPADALQVDLGKRPERQLLAMTKELRNLSGFDAQRGTIVDGPQTFVFSVENPRNVYIDNLGDC